MNTASTKSLPTDESTPENDKIMSLWEHVDELRIRLVRSLAALLISFIGTLAFAEHAVRFLKAPLAAAMPNAESVLHFIGPMDVFVVYIKVAFLGGILFSSPIWIYQFWRFFEPALYQHEKKYILPFTIASFSLFLFGVVFCYSLILPMALEYLVNLGGDEVKAMIGISEYFSVVLLMILGFGLVFEAPLVLVLLAFLDLISSEMLTKNRRFIIIIILVVSAIFTPPDPISQIGMAIPIYIMFELALVIIKIIEKKRASSEKRALNE